MGVDYYTFCRNLMNIIDVRIIIFVLLSQNARTKYYLQEITIHKNCLDLRLYCNVLFALQWKLLNKNFTRRLGQNCDDSLQIRQVFVKFFKLRKANGFEQTFNIRHRPYMSFTYP